MNKGKKVKVETPVKNEKMRSEDGSSSMNKKTPKKSIENKHADKKMKSIKEEENEEEEEVSLFKRPKIQPKKEEINSKQLTVKEEKEQVSGGKEEKREVKEEEEEVEEKNWEDLGILSWISRTCRELGMNIPTPIQRQSIPSILKAGRDIIGASPTGSGKTAAFALPIIQNLCEDPFGIFAVILTPTRELAIQIGDQFKAIGLPMGIKCSIVIGGEQMIKQAAELSKKPHVIICTPGRLYDHIRSNSIPLNRIRFLVLDEADMLLNDDGQWNTISHILPHLGKNRSTLLFSATMGLNEERLETLKLNNPHTFSVGAKLNTVETLQQNYLFINGRVKDMYLAYLLRLEEAKDAEANGENEEEIQKKKKGKSTYSVQYKKKRKTSQQKAEKSLEELLRKKDEDEEFGAKQFTTVMVFVARTYTAQVVHEICAALDISSTPLHGEMSQPERLKSIQKFRAGSVRVLISTDVASRGLDIPTVGLVINYDMPNTVEDYIHRVGRTARAGREGRAVTFVTPPNIPGLQSIESELKIKMTELETEEKEVLRHMQEATTARALSIVKLDNNGFGNRRKTIALKRKRTVDDIKNDESDDD